MAFPILAVERTVSLLYFSAYIPDRCEWRCLSKGRIFCNDIDINRGIFGDSHSLETSSL
ncbi:hypothetical protein BDN70DRAFT_881778 [Pholiota conissans]|uniref:Uncharacterized protein n=1 Tax=Pholiota conissans TaxID=109636 RepID=A0A9P6CRE4_9AGAR|nr:hypothetical protein BDN70DRAFT_881778 [Pholiota conissans]